MILSQKRKYKIDYLFGLLVLAVQSRKRGVEEMFVKYWFAYLGHNSEKSYYLDAVAWDLFYHDLWPRSTE